MLKNIFYIIFFLAFYINPVLSQKYESLHSENFKAGKEILVITNRNFTVEDSVYHFDNSVTNDGELNFFCSTFFNDSSVINTNISINTIINEIKEKEGNWLLFVHGDSKTYEQAVMRGMDINELYGINVLVFAWPSRDENLNGIKNFKRSYENLQQSALHFQKLIEFVSNLKNNNTIDPSQNISALFHSLGNGFLKDFANDTKPDKQEKVFTNLIINSAAVNQYKHSLWVENLNIQDRIFIISNKHDFNLKGLRIFTKEGKQLGEKIKPPLAANANYINFSKAVGLQVPTGITHTFFIGVIPNESSNIWKFYNRIFNGYLPELNEQSRFSIRKKNDGYNILF